MKRGRKEKYRHLLRAMRPGDVIYLASTAPRMDRHITGAVYRGKGVAHTANFIAVLLDPSKAHRVVRVEMIKAMEE